ncbi:MAG: hypothetical protein ACE1S7_08640, partial [Candidatus Tisiphia sp.]
MFRIIIAPLRAGRTAPNATLLLPRLATTEATALLASKLLKNFCFLAIILLFYNLKNIIHFYIPAIIRPLSKLACAEGFEGDASPQTAAYSNSVTDSSTASLS